MEIVIQKRKKLKLIVLVHKSHAQVFLEMQEEALGYQMKCFQPRRINWSDFFNFVMPLVNWIAVFCEKEFLKKELKDHFFTGTVVWLSF